MLISDHREKGIPLTTQGKLTQISYNSSPWKNVPNYITMIIRQKQRLCCSFAMNWK